MFNTSPGTRDREPWGFTAVGKKVTRNIVERISI
jgi:hypothetical protein